MAIRYEKLYQKVLPALKSKLEEIQYFQYEGISLEDLWNYCIEKKWRKKNIEQIHLHEMVHTILSLKPSEIVTFHQIQQFQTSTNWFNDENQEEFDELFNGDRKDGNNED